MSTPRAKSRLISTLITKCKEANIVTEQAVEDADCIVKTANSLISDHESVAVVGEDVDLLVIMIGTNTSPNVYFLKPGKGKAPPSLYHLPNAFNKDVAE